MLERLDSRTDVLTEVLEAVHLGSALSARTELRAPWSLHFGGGGDQRAGFHVVVSGSCRAGLDTTGEQVALGPGDVIVFPHGTGHSVGDPPDTTAVEFADLVAGLSPGEWVVVACEASASPPRCCAARTPSADGANPLLRGLPPMLHVPADPNPGGALDAAVSLLASEAGGIDSGSALVVDRLVDLLFVYALRTWLSQRGAAAAGSWFGALHDPVVGAAVRAVHDHPGHAWTVAALAQRSGLSRAPFARRFRHAVGEPPLAYVTRWRMTVAADLLEQGERIATVAHRVGYDNEFAFAKAFKRVRGVTPG